MAIAAELVGELNQKSRRSSSRREMKLRARGSPGRGKATDVLIRNLSTTGMLLEGAAGLLAGQKIAVDLPRIGQASAEIVWVDGELCGCAFDVALSEAAVSAALLRSEPKSLVDEAPAGTAPTGDAASQPLGERIRRIRLARGLSLVEFAHKMNVSRPTVWAWEAGKSAPRPRKRQLLLKVLETTEAELYGSPQAPGDPAQSEEALDESALKRVVRDAKAAIAAVAGTSPEKVTLIIEI